MNNLVFESIDEFVNEDAKPNFTIKSNERLKATFSNIKDIKAQLKRVGYASHHNNFKVLDDTFKVYKDKGTVLCRKLKDIELRFDFESAWYEQKTKASLSGYIGARKIDIVEKFRPLYDAERKKYEDAFSVNGFCAERLKEMCEKAGVKVTGGSGYYAENAGSIYLYLASGELK